MITHLEPIWEPGWYLWRNKDSNVRVFVTGYLGLGSDGKHYMAVDGSVTGIPFDQLVKTKKKKKNRRKEC